MHHIIHKTGSGQRYSKGDERLVPRLPRRRNYDVNYVVLLTLSNSTPTRISHSGRGFTIQSLRFLAA